MKKLYLLIFTWTIIMTILFIPVYIIGFNTIDERLNELRSDSESKISYLDDNIVVLNGILNETPQKSFEIGDKGFFVNIDSEKEFTKEEVYKDLIKNDMKYGYYFGKTKLITITKSGREEINYKKFATNSNLIEGREIVWELEMHKDMYINLLTPCLQFFSLFIAHIFMIILTILNQYIDKKYSGKIK